MSLFNLFSTFLSRSFLHSQIDPLSPDNRLEQIVSIIYPKITNNYVFQIFIEDHYKSEELGNEYANRAENEYTNKNYLKSLRNIIRAIAMFPPYSDNLYKSYCIRAKILNQLGDHIAALIDLNRGLSHNFNDELFTLELHQRKLQYIDNIEKLKTNFEIYFVSTTLIFKKKIN